MKLSTNLRYGLRAMIEIAMNEEDKPIVVQSIAEKQLISRKYLDKILLDLKKAGLVNSTRGYKGGYTLARPSSEINVYDIAKAVGDTPTLVDCIESKSYCSRRELCVTFDFWEEVSNVIRRMFENKTLEMLVIESKEKEANYQLFYI